MPEANPNVETTPPQNATPVEVEAKVFDRDGKPVLGKDGTPFDPDRLQSAFDNLSKTANDDKGAAKKLKDLEASQTQAETDRMEKQGEFERLANERKAKLEKLEPEHEAMKADYESIQTVMHEGIDDTISDWPDEVKDCVPTAEEANASARFTALKKFRPLAEKLMGEPPKPSPTMTPRNATSNGHQAKVNNATPTRHTPLL